jgi:tetratricopeptide (TPR) repeat protein
MSERHPRGDEEHPGGDEEHPGGDEDRPDVPPPPESAGTPADDEDGRESAYELLQRGRELSAARHHAQAAIVLERAARQAPGKGSILEALGRAYYNSGQHDLARATFEQLLEIDPSGHYAHYALGQSLKQLGRTREARTHLRLAVALDPGSGLYQGALRRLGPPPPSERAGER